MLCYVIFSSYCFVIVKEKWFLMEYGYFLDVLVRKVVMFVVIKLVGGFYFVDFLRKFVN